MNRLLLHSIIPPPLRFSMKLFFTRVIKFAYLKEKKIDFIDRLMILYMYRNDGWLTIVESERERKVET